LGRPPPTPGHRGPRRRRGTRLRLPVALTVAGSDSGGGAGIQADLKTFAALGVHGTSAITAVTAQNTVAVTDIVELPVAVVRAQIDAVAVDIGVQAAKTGMLSSAAIIEAVSAAIAAHRIGNLVVDPVMVAKSGARLLREDAVDILRSWLLPLAAVLTPNLPEVEVLLRHRVATLAERREAARELLALGPRAVVVKGGHAEGDAVDIYWDGTTWEELAAPRFATANTHGSGCVFSAAIAAGLAKGLDPLAAVREAKEFISGAIEFSLELGHGHGPVNPMYRLER
jgi:hydroxymethylpyrimidine/phosphomethylpyrimidine kinase